MIQYPLKTSGRHIVDSTGQRVKLAGVNVCAEFDDMVPCSSDYVDRKDLAALIASLGFNSIRFNFALRMVTNDVQANPALLSANTDLIGASTFEVYQEYVKAFTDAGLMVIPCCHVIWPGWCCSEVDGQGLWYNANWAPSKFFDGWTKMATTFASNPLVIGYDLKNEPRNTTINGRTYTPSWGDGNYKTDFHLAYQTAANNVLSVSSDKLVICEGLSYATNLRNVRAHPVLPASNVVYSMHDYSWFHPGGQSYTDYQAQVDNNGGYLLTQNIAPVWFGEFGMNASKPSNILNGWAANWWDYAANRDVDWCLWHADSVMHKATEQTTNKPKVQEGQWESFSILATDYKGPSSPTLLKQLKAIM